MRIHSDTLDRDTVFRAALAAKTYAEVLSAHGSRSRAGAFEVQLSGSSPYTAQSGAWKAATWDEWGVFLDSLFDIDPHMIAGPYNGRNDFIDKTQEDVNRNEGPYAEAVGKPRPYMTAPWLA